MQFCRPPWMVKNPWWAQRHKKITNFFRLQNTEKKNKKDSENGNYPET